MVAQRRYEMKRLYSILILMTLGVFVAGAAQVMADCTISGTITDQTGHGVPGVLVGGTLLHEPTGGTFPQNPSNLTDASGHYSLLLFTAANLFDITGGYWQANYNVVPRLITQPGTVSPTSTPVWVTCAAIGYPSPIVNFSATIAPKSGQICFQSTCGNVTIPSVCQFCPNGMKVVSAGNSSCPPHGIQMPIIEDACK
jgi:hypothetical protein